MGVVDAEELRLLIEAREQLFVAKACVLHGCHGVGVERGRRDGVHRIEQEEFFGLHGRVPSCLWARALFAL